jgi:hypothetical protein
MKKKKMKVEADKILQQDIAEQNALDVAGNEWTTRPEKSSIATTLGLYCYIQSYLPRVQNPMEKTLLSTNRYEIEVALHEYMNYLSSKGKVYVSEMRQAVRVGDFVIVFLYTIGGSDEDMGKIQHNLQILEVAQLNPVKIALEVF